MKLLPSKEILERFEKYFQEGQFGKAYYIPPKKHNKLIEECINELYSASFLEEEGVPILFRIFIGGFSNVRPNFMAEKLGYTKDALKKDFFKFKKHEILNAGNLNKLALATDPKRFTIIAGPGLSGLLMKGVIYFSGFPLQSDITSAYERDADNIGLEFLGFVFESLGKGHLSINYKGICCEIKKGKITWLNLERLDTEKFFNNDPFSDEMQKIFDHDNPFNESFLYNPMLDGIKRAELAGRGATIICTTDKNAEKLNLIPKIGVNIQFTSFCWRDPLKRNYFYNRISDFIFYFSQIDGAVLITNTAIKGYGVKIRQKIKTILPKEFKNKGMRHQSAYSLVKSSSGSPI